METELAALLRALGVIAGVVLLNTAVILGLLIAIFSELKRMNVMHETEGCSRGNRK